ncbi:ABC transporter ATP-binding protein [Thalassospira marina]|uniref:ABC transporter ATP-binding protein n=1 Tax=Thalassospira marina TaxID=2048283 RepID=A0ABM6QF20_9PROT|nr:ABC transporter ATP-binding protein [Thalassospira marina]AUG55230.1 ABC transporter ATP-binding protein [Thalassospira marina]
MTRRRRFQFMLLFGLIFFSALAEMISIGAVVPFLGIISAPDKVFEYEIAKPIVEFFGFTKPNQLLVPLTAIFAGTAIFSGALRLALVIVQTRLSFSVGHEISVNIYQKILFQPYYIHASRNSSDVINSIYTKSSTVTSGVILPFLTLMHGVVMMLSVMASLIFINPMASISSFMGFGFIYFIIIVSTRNQLVSDSQKVADSSTEAIKVLQEGLGGIRDVLIHGSQNTYCNYYQSADFGLKRALGNTYIIGQSPRFLMEALGILLMSVLAFFLASQSDGIIGAIPVLGAIALGAQRLLPVLQQQYQAWSSLRGSQISFEDTLDLLDQKLPDYVISGGVKPIFFENEIYLDHVSFCYDKNQDWILRDIDFKIKKGSRVGFVGVTGSGKTTLIDIVMGLLVPTEGTVKVDGVAVSEEIVPAWQKHIAHVPQDIFLADTTIAENIAFGVPRDQVDLARVKDVAFHANILRTIESWRDGFHTVVGERGVKLSGGQRQRIGIARALYRQADVIIFDEATSALDSETEEAIMEAIDGLSRDLTVLMIAHRHSTLRACDEIVHIANGSIELFGDYQNFIKRNVKLS